MKANEFVKKFGWGEAKKILNPKGIYLDLAYLARKEHGLNINDLKRLVDAWELVESLGGLAFAKNFLDKTGSTMGGMLEQAIQLVESVNA